MPSGGVPHKRRHTGTHVQKYTHARSFCAVEEKPRPEGQGHSLPPVVSLGVSAASPHDSGCLPLSLDSFLCASVHLWRSSLLSSPCLWLLRGSPFLLCLSASNCPVSLCLGICISNSKSLSLCVSGLCPFPDTFCIFMSLSPVSISEWPCSLLLFARSLSLVFACLYRPVSLFLAPCL